MHRTCCLQKHFKRRIDHLNSLEYNVWKATELVRQNEICHAWQKCWQHSNQTAQVFAFDRIQIEEMDGTAKNLLLFKFSAIFQLSIKISAHFLVISTFLQVSLITVKNALFLSLQIKFWPILSYQVNLRSDPQDEMIWRHVLGTVRSNWRFRVLVSRSSNSLWILSIPLPFLLWLILIIPL